MPDYKKINLLQFMKAFIVDNNVWLTKSKSNLTITQSKFAVNGNDDAKVREFITVIGGSKNLTGGVNVDPANINIYVSNERIGEITPAYKNIKNTTLLIAWVNEVLQDNGLTALSAGDQKSLTDTQGQIVLFYDSDNASVEIKKLNGINTDNVSGGGFLEDTFLEKIDSRLQVQDDVFSFKFRGSLVEDLSIEKVETPTLQKILATQNLAESIDASENDVTKSTGEKTQQQIEQVYRTGNNAVTYKDKKRALTILYASMLGANIKSIGHPWVRIGKPIGIKGTGFFDGRYIVTKVKHIIDNTNKFTTEINACRILNQADKRLAVENQERSSEIAQESGGINKSEQVKQIENKQNSKYTLPPIPTDPNKEYTYSVQQTVKNTQQQITNYLDSYSGTQDLHPKHRQKFIDFIKDINDNSNYKVLSINKSYVSPGLSYPNLTLHNYGLAITITLEHKLSKKVVGASQSKTYWGTTGITEIASNHGLVWSAVVSLTYSDLPTNYFGLDLATFDGIQYTRQNLLNIAKKSLGYQVDYVLKREDYNKIIGNKISI